MSMATAIIEMDAVAKAAYVTSAGKPVVSVIC